MNTTGRKPHKAVSHTDSHESYALLLSGCTNYAFYVFYARRNRRNSPSMARFLLVPASMPGHCCASHIIPTASKLLRTPPACIRAIPFLSRTLIYIFSASYGVDKKQKYQNNTDKIQVERTFTQRIFI